MKKIRLSIFFTNENAAANINYAKEHLLFAKYIFHKFGGFELDIKIPENKSDVKPENYMFYLATDKRIPTFSSIEAKTLRDRIKLAISELLNAEEAGIKSYIDDKRNILDNLLQLLHRDDAITKEAAIQLRMYCHGVFRDDQPTKSPSRLPIIFGEFVAPNNPYYEPSLGGITYNKEPDWLSFCVVDASRFAFTMNGNRTLAHEIIHAAGHSHTYGVADGDDTDLMNVNSFRKELSEVNIRSEHIELLNTKAYFVG